MSKAVRPIDTDRSLMLKLAPRIDAARNTRASDPRGSRPAEGSWSAGWATGWIGDLGTAVDDGDRSVVLPGAQQLADEQRVAAGARHCVHQAGARLGGGELRDQPHDGGVIKTAEADVTRVLGVDQQIEQPLQFRVARHRAQAADQGDGR